MKGGEKQDCFDMAAVYDAPMNILLGGSTKEGRKRKRTKKEKTGSNLSNKTSTVVVLSEPTNPFKIAPKQDVSNSTCWLSSAVVALFFTDFSIDLINHILSLPIIDKEKIEIKNTMYLQYFILRSMFPFNYGSVRGNREPRKENSIQIEPDIRDFIDSDNNRNKLDDIEIEDVNNYTDKLSVLYKTDISLRGDNGNPIQGILLINNLLKEKIKIIEVPTEYTELKKKVEKIISDNSYNVICLWFSKFNKKGFPELDNYYVKSIISNNKKETHWISMLKVNNKDYFYDNEQKNKNFSEKRNCFDNIKTQIKSNKMVFGPNTEKFVFYFKKPTQKLDLVEFKKLAKKYHNNIYSSFAEKFQKENKKFKTMYENAKRTNNVTTLNKMVFDNSIKYNDNYNKQSSLGGFNSDYLPKV